MVAWVHVDFVDHVWRQVHRWILRATKKELLLRAGAGGREEHVLDRGLPIRRVGSEIGKRACEALIGWYRSVNAGVDAAVQRLRVLCAPALLELGERRPTGKGEVGFKQR